MAPIETARATIPVLEVKLRSAADPRQASTKRLFAHTLQSSSKETVKEQSAQNEA
jgi:hypothetical protein